MANQVNGDEKWYFTNEQLENTPSRKCGIEANKELSYRQQAANFIQDLGQRLKVSQLCINTAIVYMHRFYVFHSFTHFPWHSIASASVFLAAKVEEQPRKLEHVIKYANHCKNSQSNIEIGSERYQAQSQDLVFNENVLLQTLGFDVAIDHPHTHVVRCCHLVRASKDLAQTSYFMASNSLHLTTMCLQYKPTVVACFCINLVCKWSHWEIPLSNEKKEWFSYVDPTVTAELLQQLTQEFFVIFDKSPSRLKEKVMAIRGFTPENEKKISLFPDPKDPYHRPHHGDSKGTTEEHHKHRTRPHDGSSSSHSQMEREYRDKRDTERMARHASSKPSSAPNASGKQPPHGYHRPPVDQKTKPHSRPSSTGHQSTTRPEQPRDILREATKDIGLKDYRDQARESTDSSNRDINPIPKEINRDIQVRNDKDPQKRDYLHKPNINEINTLSDRANSSAEKHIDLSRSRQLDSNKISKHEQLRRSEESKPYIKGENDIKKHINSSAYDKSSAFINKSSNSTSRKMESPFTSDTSKSVLKQNPNMPAKQESHNGSTNGSSFNLPLFEESKVKIEKEEIMPPPVKKPSLFSPEKSPPSRTRTPPSNKHLADTSTIPSTSQLPPTLSPFSSPVSVHDRRNRTVSSSSEPELRPVMKKIDQVEGFENLLRDSSIGIKVNHQVPDIITPITDIKVEKIETTLSKELKPPDLIPPFTPSNNVPLSQPLVNGIETNPTLISNLLKQTPTVPHLPTIASPVQKEDIREHKDKDHHKERKKKSKEKHKHKDRSKDDKEKKKKHKDKDREKHKSKEKNEVPVAQPIKITISKDKIQPPESPVVSTGLKIKIAKDRIKTDNIGELSQPAGGIKIKISKDVITSYSGESKKRERDKTLPTDTPPNKISKSSYNRSSDSKQNGRNSYNKVSNYNNNKIRPQHFNNNMQNNVAHIPPPGLSNYMYYQQHGMPIPQVPFSMNMPPPPLNMNMPPPSFLYGNPQMYSNNTNYQLYPSIYPPPPPVSSGSQPPLPRDAPPEFLPPPPPPDEY